MRDPESVMEEADGLMLLGLYQEAVDLLDTLPELLRFGSRAMPTRTICMSGLGRSTELMQIIERLVAGSAEDRRAAAAATVTIALQLLDAGNPALARELVRAAVEIRPWSRAGFMKIPRLAALLDSGS